MSEITLQAEQRSIHGSGPVSRLRLEGKLPAVLYGKGMETQSITVDHREVRHAFNDSANRANPFTLVLDGKSHTVKLQAIQRHPVKNTAVHIDFMVV